MKKNLFAYQQALSQQSKVVVLDGGFEYVGTIKRVDRHSEKVLVATTSVVTGNPIDMLFDLNDPETSVRL